MPGLYKDQITAPEALCERDVYFGANTSYGKSLLFQALSLLMDETLEQAVGSSTVLVLSPLVALMKEQVTYVNETVGLPVAITDDGEDEVR